MTRVSPCLAFILVQTRGDTCQGIVVTSVTSKARTVEPADPGDQERGVLYIRHHDTEDNSPVDTHTVLATLVSLYTQVTLINILLTT